MLRPMLLVVAAIGITACTATPFREPLDQARSGKLAQPTIYARTDDRGIGVQYVAQNSTAAGAPYGLVGALVAATIDAMANAGPLDIAQDSADALAPKFSHGETDAAFRTTLRDQLAALPMFDAPPAIQALAADQKWEAAAFGEPAVLLVSVDYALSPDLRSLDVILSAAALRRGAGAEPGKAETKKHADRVYRNRLEYHSPVLAAMAGKTPEQIDEEIARIRAKYPQAARDAKQKVAMQKEINSARRERPADEKARYYLEQWLANDAALLRSELQTGFAGVTAMLVKDILDPTQIDTSGSRPVRAVVSEDAQRRLMRNNLGPYIGSLSSEPVGFEPAPWNGIAYFRKPKAGESPAGTQ